MLIAKTTERPGKPQIREVLRIGRVQFDPRD